MTEAMQRISKHLYRNKLRVLFYHRVNNYSSALTIDPNKFENQIKYVSNHYNCISQKKYIQALEGKVCVKNALLITFDDGYKDNYMYAYPILKKYSVPAVIFLSTDFIDGEKWLWLDMIRYIIEKTTFNDKVVQLGNDHYRLNLTYESKKIESKRALFSYFRDIPYNERVDLIKDLALELEVGIPDKPTAVYSALSWREIKEMAKNKIEFGAHTCSHEILSEIDINSAYHEIAHSKKRIEDELQTRVDSFAYPNGQAGDFTEGTKILLKKAGYKVGFTTINGMNTRYTDRFQNNRISGIADSEEYFASNVSGLNIIKARIKNIIDGNRQAKLRYELQKVPYENILEEISHSYLYEQSEKTIY